MIKIRSKGGNGALLTGADGDEGGGVWLMEMIGNENSVLQSSVQSFHNLHRGWLTDLSLQTCSTWESKERPCRSSNGCTQPDCSFICIHPVCGCSLIPAVWVTLLSLWEHPVTQCKNHNYEVTSSVHAQLPDTTGLGNLLILKIFHLQKTQIQLLLEGTPI